MSGRRFLDDEIDREHERSLRAVDPRGQISGCRPRMVMLEDDPPTVAERGMLLDDFVEPDE